MKKLTILLLGFFLLSGQLFSQQIKNIIILIPDGTSTDLVSLSRWFNDNESLAVDEILCGMIQTHSIDNKFPGSAPTSTAYSTGVNTIAKHIGVDSAAQPQINILELAKLNGLSTGIVATCEFPHATPADFVCHHPDRKNYPVLVNQMLYNSPDLLFAGGKTILDTINNGQSKKIFEDLDYQLITEMDEFQSLTSLNKQAVWALFTNPDHKKEYLSYAADKDSRNEPDLASMTSKAISLLNQNEKGFFLMVEGSQIDWACHVNDTYAAVTEFLDFDKAVAVALDFAKKDQQTIVIVCPDHGTGGLSIGNLQSGMSFHTKNPNEYIKKNIQKSVVEPLRQIQFSARHLAEQIIRDDSYLHSDSIFKYYNCSLDEKSLSIMEDIQKNDWAFEDKSDTLQYIIASSFNKNNFIGWTTTGHTAEDVFLAIYAPSTYETLNGIHQNTVIGKYMLMQLGFESFSSSTKKYYSPHTAIFTKDEIISVDDEKLELRIDDKILRVYGNTNRVEVYSKKPKFLYQIELDLIAVALKNKNNSFTYYLPEKLREQYNQH
jgi:alkaline phosphatase